MRRGATGLCGVIAVDKPAGMTSHDVVDAVRRTFGERRCGHVGTLDPAATGLLLVAVGPATRLCSFLGGHDKSYVARIAFGTGTDTDDADGTVVERAEVDARLEDEDVARGLLGRFRGDLMQVPPAYSALKRQGKRAYEVARAGGTPELSGRPVHVASADLVDVRVDDGVLCWDVRFVVSTGTYIRALARDLGHEAGTCAHLSALRRMSIGDVSVSQALSLDELADTPFEQACLDPAAALGFPCHELSGADARKVASGGKLSLGLGFEGDVVSLVRDGRLLALYERRAGCYAPRAVIPGGVFGVRA
ncbi:MAG: tRNA pseudouridine(55) synthase TruB [Coriobacteriales bacterium]